jgi:hypothetical protein
MRNTYSILGSDTNLKLKVILTPEIMSYCQASVFHNLRVKMILSGVHQFRVVMLVSHSKDNFFVLQWFEVGQAGSCHFLTPSMA